MNPFKPTISTSNVHWERLSFKLFYYLPIYLSISQEYEKLIENKDNQLKVLELEHSQLTQQYNTTAKLCQQLSTKQENLLSQLQDVEMENTQIKSRLVVLREELERIDLARQVAEHHRVNIHLEISISISISISINIFLLLLMMNILFNTDNVGLLSILIRNKSLPSWSCY